MAVTDEITGARVTMRRRLAWHEMDPAGHNHFAATLSWLEEAEHCLWRGLGLMDHISRLPRVHVEVDYLDRIFLAERLDVTLGVVAVGTTSCTLGISVACLGIGPIGEPAAVPDGDRTQPRLVAEGRCTIVHTRDSASGPQPWSDRARALLATPRVVLPS